MKINETEELMITGKDKIKLLLLNIVGFMMAAIKMPVINPLGLAFFSALNMYRGTGLISVVAIALSMTKNYDAASIVKTSMILLAITTIYRILSYGNLKLKEVPGAVICGLMVLVMEISDLVMDQKINTRGMGKETLIAVLVAVGVAGITGVLQYIFRKSVRGVLGYRKVFDNMEMFGIALGIGCGIYGGSIILNIPYEFVELMVFLSVIMLSYKRGVGMAAFMGIAGAIPVCMLNGNGKMAMSYVGMVVSVGMLIGIFRELGKSAVVAITLSYSLLGAYVLFPELVDDSVMKGILGATIIFLALPSSIVYRDTENISGDNSGEINNICGDRLLNVAKSFEQISRYMTNIGKNTNNVEEGMEGVANYENNIWKSKINESRNMMSNQFEQVAKIIEEYSKSVYDFVKITPKQEEYIRAHLKNNRIHMDRIVGIENSRGQKEYLVTAKCEKGFTVGSREIGKIISEALGKNYIPSKNCRKLISNEFTTTTYVEATNFVVEHAAAGKASTDNGISGDNYSLKELDNGQLLMGLSDGMGSGASACVESETVIELLEQLLEGGFDPDIAMKMINSVMVMNSREEHPATLDYGIIDLHSGKCDLVKIGAAATFVKRGNWVETIKSTSMPLGVFSELDYDSTSKKLYDGDMVIMMSDGVLDAIEGDNKSENMGKIISEINSNNPGEIARKILDYATEKKERLGDDMTVLVTGIWENKKIA